MKMFTMICASIAMLANSSRIYGQENTDKVSLSVDVASSFIWRGLALNTSPVIQPSFTFTPGKFSMGVWASTPFTSGEYQEVDVFINYRFTPSLSISLSDYFGYDYSWWDSPAYFNYKRGETNHIYDLQLIYDGTGKFPIKTMVSTIIAGDDLRWSGKNSWEGKWKNNFSTYIELGYENRCKSVDWEIFAGMVPMASENFYGITGASVINLGLGLSKSFEITPTYSLPLAIKLAVNPAMESVFVSAVITLF